MTTMPAVVPAYIRLPHGDHTARAKEDLVVSSSRLGDILLGCCTVIALAIVVVTFTLHHILQHVLAAPGAQVDQDNLIAG